MKHYKRQWIEGKCYHAHRLIWEEANGKIPEGMHIDHINGDIHDNSLDNLRCVSNGDNQHNRQSTKGFYFDKKHSKWHSRIIYDGKKIDLGRHDTIIDARASYLRKHRELLGAEFNGRA